MAKQVPWNKIILEHFIEIALLEKDEEAILRSRIAGWSRVKQSHKFNMSLSSVDRIIARLKSKYDLAAKHDPVLPERKSSAKETYSTQD